MASKFFRKAFEFIRKVREDLQSKAFNPQRAK